MLFLTHCGGGEKVEPVAVNLSGESITEVVAPEVTIVQARLGQLPLRRQTNGNLRARREITISSQIGGVLTLAPVEGKYYRRGDTLAVTDLRPVRLAVDRAMAAREEAAFRHRDLLLRLSINLPPGDTVLPRLARDNALIQSGLPAAEVALREAHYALTQAIQLAPFAGRAAEVEAQAGQLVGVGEEICTLIDPTSLEAEFTLLEQEIPRLDQGHRITVSPLALPEVKIPATLDIVNPRVNDGGLLRVRARLGNTGSHRLYPGMNVMVTIAGHSDEAVLLPKEALVLRSGRPVVFTYDEESARAKWQYVSVLHENDEMIAVGEGVEPGASVIVSGNLNLDHDARVIVKVK
ncbi:RND family efflux transporter MFP subunit [Lewinella marina]|uniref:efflux RND transporter periplasmic adaptor subunit n=1 Tax=Neolewinella marina TaxID=438751 RepID=UPI0016921402|nr:efflux RND transporter periplasmic adaptor subunit [Neolewinella marina]NJB84498.1 RND family efflux transporter MFP subunit [Neolewinella marina]